MDLFSFKDSMDFMLSFLLGVNAMYYFGGVVFNVLYKSHQKWINSSEYKNVIDVKLTLPEHCTTEKFVSYQLPDNLGDLNVVSQIEEWLKLLDIQPVENLNTTGLTYYLTSNGVEGNTGYFLFIGIGTSIDHIYGFFSQQVVESYINLSKFKLNNCSPFNEMALTPKFLIVNN